MTEKNGMSCLDPEIYAENRGRFPLAELSKYYGQWVAWSFDGARIVAHHEDLIEAARLVEATGVAREDVVFDRLPPEGEGTML